MPEREARILTLLLALVALWSGLCFAFGWTIYWPRRVTVSENFPAVVFAIPAVLAWVFLRRGRLFWPLILAGVSLAVLLPGCLVLPCEGRVRVGQTVLVGLILGAAAYAFLHRDAFELAP